MGVLPTLGCWVLLTGACRLLEWGGKAWLFVRLHSSVKPALVPLPDAASVLPCPWGALWLAHYNTYHMVLELCTHRVWMGLRTLGFLWGDENVLKLIVVPVAWLYQKLLDLKLETHCIVYELYLNNTVRIFFKKDEWTSWPASTVLTNSTELTFNCKNLFWSVLSEQVFCSCFTVGTCKGPPTSV